MSRLRNFDRFLALVSIAWLGALGLVPGLPERQEAFVVTAGLVAGNFLVSAAVFLRSRRLLMALNAVQFILFGVLSAQLAWAYGAEHFDFQHPPAFYDWAEFTLAHMLRAADLLDALDECGVHLQAIHHQSAAAGLILVGLHIHADLFLLGLVGRRLWSLWKRLIPPAGTSLQRGRRGFVVLLLAAIVLAGYLPCALWQSWGNREWYRWPLDNVLRLLDIGDVMQIFQLRLHSVEMGSGTEAYAVAFRCAAAIWLARLAPWVRLWGFRENWYSVEELIEFLHADAPTLRTSAAAALARLGPSAEEAVGPLHHLLAHDLYAEVRCQAAAALGRIGPASAPAVPTLIRLLEHSDDTLRRAAARALGRIGPAARVALPSLRRLLEMPATSYRLSQAAASAIERLEETLEQVSRSGRAG